MLSGEGIAPSGVGGGGVGSLHLPSSAELQTSKTRPIKPQGSKRYHSGAAHCAP